MKKDYFSLDVICKRHNRPDEKLVFQNGKYTTREYSNRTFLANEGPLSNIEKTSVNLLNWNDIEGLTLPSDVEGFSLVLNSKSLLTSSHVSVIRTNESKKIASVDLITDDINHSLSDTLKQYAQKVLELFNKEENDIKHIRK